MYQKQHFSYRDPMSEPQKITRDYALANRLVFTPSSPDEAIAIQERIFAMGFKWANGVTEVQNVNECVQTGMLLDHGELYYHPSKSDRNIPCTIHQLDESYMPPLERKMTEMFNTLMARMDTLQEQMDRIERRLGPETIEKSVPKLRPPGQGHM
jgi:hypothetical protein